MKCLFIVKTFCWFNKYNKTKGTQPIVFGTDAGSWVGLVFVL